MPGTSPYLQQSGSVPGGYNAPQPTPGSTQDPNATPYQDPNNNGNYGYTNTAPNMFTDAVDVDPNQTTAGAYATGTQAGSQAAQQQAYNQTAALAQGKGPSLATQLLNQQAAAAMGNTNAMASSAQGSQSALARRQAMMQGGQQMQALGAQGATARAQEQLGATQLQGQQAAQMRSQDQTLAAQGLGTTYNQAGLNLGEYGVSKGVQVANEQMAIQGGQDVAMGIGAGLSLLSSPQAKTDVQAADMHLSEPGGGAHWIIREEPNFLLAANARTGEFRKILTAPLSPEEHSQAMKKHGAGPVGSPNPGNKYYGDLDMSNPQPAPQPMQAQQPQQPMQPMQAPAMQTPQMGAPQVNQPAVAPMPQQVTPQMMGQSQEQASPNNMPTNTTPTPAADDMTKRRQAAGEFLKQMGKNGGPSVSGIPHFDAPNPQTFKFPTSGGDGSNQAADADLGGSAGDDYSKQFANASPGFVKQPEQASTLSSPPAAKQDIQSAESLPRPTIQHGSDQVAQSFMRPGEQTGSGYGLAARPMAEPKVAPESIDYSKADTPTLSSMAEHDQAAGEWPKGDIDLSEYRGALERAVDKRRDAKGLPFFNNFDTRYSDPGMPVGDMSERTNDAEIYNLKPGQYDPDFVAPERHFNEDRIIAPAPKKPAPKPPVENAKYPGSVAADVHLGRPGIKPPSVRTPGVGIKTPKASPPKVENALRKLSPYSYSYKNPKNQPSPASPMSKYFGVMTTDVKKDPIAKNMVSGKGASEKIAVPAATSFNLAAGAHLQKAHDGLARRVSLLERKFGNR